MPTAHVRLKPTQWFQEIGHYPKEGGEGRYLRATCTYSDDYDDYNVHLSTGAKLSAFLADLSIMDEEPQYADGKPLEHGIGLLVFKRDRPELAASTNGWFSLRGKNYDAVWDQVHHGGYAGCNIDMWLSPLLSEPTNLVWDVDRPVFITAASVRFARIPPLQELPTQPRRRRRLFSRR
jgi:hypothetical protein